MSPCPPKTFAEIEFTDVFSLWDMKVINLAVSNTPAIPNTSFVFLPLTWYAFIAIASNGFVTTMSNAFGEWFNDFSVTSATMFILIFRRSSLDIPGFLATPDVITIISESLYPSKNPGRFPL